MKLINCYTQTQDRNKFYFKLDRVCDLLLNIKIKILFKDFNAKIGQELNFSPIIKINSLHEKSNDNNTQLINFVMTWAIYQAAQLFSFYQKDEQISR